jgi:hypothetical protein
MTALPIACTLTPTELESRGSQLLPGLVARSSARLELPNGYRWSFSPTDGLMAEITRVIDAERRCCRFLQFFVVVEERGGAVTLEVTGPNGTREFLAQLIAKSSSA